MRGRGGWLDLFQAAGDVRWLERGHRALHRHRTGPTSRAGDGGFFDTADDAEQLVARPRDPSDNASPSGQSSLVHALVVAAAITGEPRYREGREAALASVHGTRHGGAALRRLVAGRGRGDDGDGPAEVAVVGPPGARRDSLRTTRRVTTPRRSCLVAGTVRATTYPCWWDATPSTGSRRRTSAGTTSARHR